MPVTQQIMAGGRIDRFAGESEQTTGTTLDPPMTVGRVDLTHISVGAGHLQYRALLISDQQQAVALGTVQRLHCQQLPVVLKHAVRILSFQLRHQVFAAVEPGQFFQLQRLQFDQPIQSIIAVAIEGASRWAHEGQLPAKEAVCTRLNAPAPSRTVSAGRKLSPGFAQAREDSYFPLRRRKDLFFETPLQGRTTFGQNPGQNLTRTRTWQTYNRRNGWIRRTF
ncbi:hypothetical protein D3C86_1278870 [compost metagenome]